MGEAIGQVLPMAVGVALSPIPIIAVVLMLVTPRAKVNGPMFIVGWLIGLAAVGVIVLAVIGPNSTDDGGDAATGVSWLKVVLGILLLLVALAVVAGGALAGFLGIFLAVPVVASGAVALDELRKEGIFGRDRLHEDAVVDVGVAGADEATET